MKGEKDESVGDVISGVRKRENNLHPGETPSGENQK